MLLALDFDGVICDSINECAYVSFLAYNGLTNVTKINLDLVPGAHLSKFRDYRYLVGPGQDYYYLWRSIYEYETNNSDTIEHYFRRIVDTDDQEAETFASNFYRIRRQIRKHDQDTWIDLNRLYEQLRESLTIASSSKKYIVVTAKDNDSVYEILTENHIDIQRKDIYGRELGKNKNEIFQELSEERKVNLSNIYFVDDNFENVMNAHNIGISARLASWGYNSRLDKVRAREKGIKLMEITELTELLHDVAGMNDG